MKVTREQAELNRERVLDVAARLFRERGFDGIGVADLMKSAGLTHGGFYGQFASKEALMAEACERSFARSVDNWQRLADGTAGDPLPAIAKDYLSMAHRDHPGAGCVVAALGAEGPRQGPALHQAIGDGVRAQIAKLIAVLPGRSTSAKRQRAITSYASMVGALVLARAVDDEALAREILKTVAASLARPA